MNTTLTSAINLAAQIVEESYEATLVSTTSPMKMGHPYILTFSLLTADEVHQASLGQKIVSALGDYPYLSLNSLILKDKIVEGDSQLTLEITIDTLQP